MTRNSTDFMAMNQSSEVDQAREARADNETLEEHSRTRKLTEKGLEYHINQKTKNLKAKKQQFTKQVRSTLIERSGKAC